MGLSAQVGRRRSLLREATLPLTSIRVIGAIAASPLSKAAPVELLSYTDTVVVEGLFHPDRSLDVREGERLQQARVRAGGAFVGRDVNQATLST